MIMPRSVHPPCLTVLFSAVFFLGAFTSVRAADLNEADGMVAPAVDFYNWRCVQRAGWWLEKGPRWVSLGHLARVLIFLPEADEDGRVHTVHLESRKIIAFEDDGATPRETRLLERLSIRADDPERLTTRRHWGFRTEERYNWEMEKIPFRGEHQTLERIFFHDDEQFWQTLMIHAEADLKREGEKAFFQRFLCHILIFDLLHDDRIPDVIEYQEQRPSRNTWWIASRDVKAPWALGKERLEPVAGEVSVEPDGEFRFAPGSRDTFRDFPASFAGRPQPSITIDEPTSEGRTAIDDLLDELDLE